jgi:pyruvate/2-oxoglutarate dehydrogenase complex dihydrolipoamide acyltransferase (E2) component
MSAPAPTTALALAPPSETREIIPHGERWLLDGLSVSPRAGGFCSLLCDMSKAQEALSALRQRGVRATPTHLIVRAAALAMARYPEAHQLVIGYRRVRTDRVDIGLSVAGQTAYAPVFIIPGADRMPLPELVAYMIEGVQRTREKEARDLEGMRRSGWIIPFGFLRRAILRWLQGRLWFRRKLVGTFQVSCLSSIDFMAPLLFYSGCVLGTGRIIDRVLAENGAPVVRPTMWATLVLDHLSVDGRIASQFLTTFRDILEGEELIREATAA